MLIPHPLPGSASITQPLSTPSSMVYSYISSEPSRTTQPLSTPSPMVYNYINPASGERVVSLLPPNHPEMICLQSGSHVPHTRFGLLGEHQSTHCLLKLTFLCQAFWQLYSGSPSASVSVYWIAKSGVIGAA
jgi:hypothetical protein